MRRGGCRPGSPGQRDSVGLLHDVEVMVQSRWQPSGKPPTATAQRASRAAYATRVRRPSATTADESAGDLRSLATLPIRIRRDFTPSLCRGRETGIAYIEMVSPDDVARFMWLEAEPSRDTARDDGIHLRAIRTRIREGGRVSCPTARLLGATGIMGADDTGELYRQFLNEPPPLGP